MEFEKFQKIPRLGSKKDQMVITEKIDGTNAQIYINDACDMIQAGSRKRWVTPGKETDNYGFARWVVDNHDELLKLGKGRHYGEWCGSGIQRRYGLDHKQFLTFNTSRPIESLPACVGQVPILYHGAFNTDTIHKIFEDLWDTGSHLCPNWFKPEGIIVYQFTSRQLFKMTYEHTEGKWTTK
jgi:hypothetical protein